MSQYNNLLVAGSTLNVQGCCAESFSCVKIPQPRPTVDKNEYHFLSFLQRFEASEGEWWKWLGNDKCLEEFFEFCWCWWGSWLSTEQLFQRGITRPTIKITHNWEDAQGDSTECLSCLKAVDLRRLERGRMACRISEQVKEDRPTATLAFSKTDGIYFLEITAHMWPLARAPTFTMLEQQCTINCHSGDWMVKVPGGRRRVTDTIQPESSPGGEMQTYVHKVFGINYKGRCYVDGRSTLGTEDTCESVQLWARPPKPKRWRCLWNHKWTSKETRRSLPEGPPGPFTPCVLEMDYKEASRVNHEHAGLLYFGGAWSSGVGPGPSREAEH